MSNSLSTRAYRENAKSLINSELEKIKNITNQRYPDFLKAVCAEIVKYFVDRDEQIIDKGDYIEFKQQFVHISSLIDLFLASNPHKSSWWALPLIKQCYEKCGIDYANRNILIIHYLNSGSYSVNTDLLSILPVNLKHLHDPAKPIDAFIIPSEAKHDIASIALLGHEVGHIYWKTNFSKIEGIVETKLAELTGQLDESNLFTQPEREEKRNRIAPHIQEYLCDSVGRYLFGPAFDFALLKHLVLPANEQNKNNSSHPPELTRIENSLNILKSYTSSQPEIQACFDGMNGYFSDLEKYLHSKKTSEKSAEDVLAEDLAVTINVDSEFNSLIEGDELNDIWNLVVPELDAFRPPFEKVSKNKPAIISPIEAIIATSIYYYGENYKRRNEYFAANAGNEHKKSELIRNKLVEHLRYAISLHGFVAVSQRLYCQESFDVKNMDTTLWDLREHKVADKLNPFVVVPSINPTSQYSTTSVDLRLGNSFLLNKTSGYTHISPNPQPTGSGNFDVPLEAFFDELFIPVGEEFILHPHQFVLAATLEYISVPFDYYALVLGRSSWGRLGLNIATATTVQAGYRGCITLELRNLGETPLPLKVGLRIAQLCLIEVPIKGGAKAYFAAKNKYIGPVAPEIPKIKDDADWELLNNTF